MLDRTLNAFVNFQFAPRVTIVPFLSITVHGPDANINPGDSDPTAPFAVRHSLGMRLGGRSNTGRCYGLSPPSSAAQADEKNKNSKGYGLKSTCEPALGSPSVANCLAAAGEFHQTGPLELKATDDPIIKIAGNCAIAIGFKAKTLTSWDLLNAVIYSLLEQCLDNPVAPRVGGITIPAPHAASNGGKIRKRCKRNFTIIFQYKAGFSNS